MRTAAALNFVLTLAKHTEKRLIAKNMDPSLIAQAAEAIDIVINHARANFVDQIEHPTRG